MKKLVSIVLLALGALLSESCVKGERESITAPQTQISLDTIRLSGNNRLNSTVSLSWFGSDADGFVTGFEISFDEVLWSFTTRQDSTFTFTLPPGTDTTDVNFFVRAIDNDDNRDPTPAHLRVPLKNTPPTVQINPDRGPSDTALAVATFFWTAADVDGNETITKVEMKANNGNWQEISRNANLISLLADTNVQNGATTAQVFIGENNTPENYTLNGLRANDTNRLFLRATDLAGAVSAADTSINFFYKIKSRGARTLWISGHTSDVTPEYQTLLNNAGVKYDLLDFGASIDGSNLPAFWDPTIKLTARLYQNIFINTESTTYTNPISGDITTILNFMAPVIQDFTNKGGKYFVTTALAEDEDLSRLIGPYPIDSLVKNGGNAQARITPDSALVSANPQAGFPAVRPEFLQRNIVPIIPASDAQVFYRAQLTKLNGWEGSNVVAAVRRPQNVLTQVFFAQELHNYNGDPQALESLFKKILVDEF